MSFVDFASKKVSFTPNLPEGRAALLLGESGSHAPSGDPSPTEFLAGIAADKQAKTYFQQTFLTVKYPDLCVNNTNEKLK